MVEFNSVFCLEITDRFGSNIYKRGNDAFEFNCGKRSQILWLN